MRNSIATLANAEEKAKAASDALAAAQQALAHSEAKAKAASDVPEDALVAT